MYKHQDVTGQVIEAFYVVYNALGYGFLEKVYENALVLELQKMGRRVVSQTRFQVYYDGQVVGEYFADLVVDDKVLVEVKATSTLGEVHTAQLLNYLKATRYEVGRLLNFGPRPQVQRKIYDNELKGSLSWVGGPKAQ